MKTLSKNPQTWWLVLVLLQIIIHLPFMNRVAMGNHVWRQCNTLAVAKNYYQVDMNILYPRIDKNYGSNGITGPQFTSYDYSLAIGYRLFGFSETAHRWWSLILSIVALLGTLSLLKRYFDDASVTFWAGMAMLGIPEFYYYSIAALPDLLALAAMVWGWWWFYRFLDSKAWSDATICGLLMCLAGMTKLMFLVPGFVFIGEIIKRKAWTWNYFKGFAWMALIALGGSLFWYLWAKYLTQMNGIEEFVHAIRFKETWQAALQVFFKNASIDLMETWIGYPLILPFLVAFYYIIKRKIRDPRVYLSLLAALLYYVFMQHQLEHHGYYMILFVPFLVLALAYFMVEIKKSNRLLIQRLGTKIQYFMMLAPLWAMIRIQHNFNLNPPNIPHEFTQSNDRAALQKISAKQDLWIVGPDQSGCVYFYYLGAKGFPWYNLGDAPSEFVKFKKMGAKGIITQDEASALDYCRKIGLETRSVHYKGWTWLTFK